MRIARFDNAKDAQLTRITSYVFLALGRIYIHGMPELSVGKCTDGTGGISFWRLEYRFEQSARRPTGDRHGRWWIGEESDMQLVGFVLGLVGARHPKGCCLGFVVGLVALAVIVLIAESAIGHQP